MKIKNIFLDSVVWRSTDVVFSRLDDELLAIDAQAGFCYSMNETAGRIWDMISAPIAVSEVCSRLTTEFKVSHDACIHDVLPLLEEMHEAGIIMIKDT